jgi:hypothetical protein
MSEDKIKMELLIEKYFEGLTTLEEERIIREYFQGQNIPEELKVYQPMFQFFALERGKGGTEKEEKRKTTGNIRWFSIAAAACLLLFFGLKFTFNIHKSLPETSWAYIDGEKQTDIELIQLEALKALENISESNETILSSQIEALGLFFDNQ